MSARTTGGSGVLVLGNVKNVTRSFPSSFTSVVSAILWLVGDVDLTDFEVEA